MFFRHARALGPDSPASSMEASFHGGEGQGASDAGTKEPQGQDRTYNEIRKLQRLLEKTTKELDTLKNEHAPLKEQLSRFQSAFGGSSKTGEDGKPKTYLDRVRMADQAVRETNPDSNGLALTLEAAELIEQLREENAKLKQNQDRMNSPMFVAEQNMFINLENGIREQMAQVFGEEGIDDNYPDFEKVALERLREINKDQKAWVSIVRSPEKQRQLIREVIAKKMPKLQNVPGWKRVETYTDADAMRDMQRAEKMAKEGREKRDRSMIEEASKIAAKARQHLLPKTLGLQMRQDY